MILTQRYCGGENDDDHDHAARKGNNGLGELSLTLNTDRYVMIHLVMIRFVL